MPGKIAFLFIGQTPRPDVMDDVRRSLGDAYTALEYGALDGLSPEQIAGLAPRSQKDTLITRLRSGSQVRVSGEAIERLLRERAARAEKDGAKLCAVMCTGSFDLESRLPVITADRAFHGQDAAESAGCIGLIVPLKEQQESFAEYYRGGAGSVITGFADPYGAAEAIVSEARRLAVSGADVIRLDCMGYTARQAEEVHAATGLPVLIPRIEVVRMIRQEKEK